ncbi:hypothetical protein AVEN_224171-1 [Araneus ventricosus]|uniref:Uncharacterized protein n=1 Tax=Araneus ventricosus TaxID=182803 RepID=A0A4Y2BK11_ARAVE|nr:hypothetical protein AVEN_224171-1 [Araneus ventricosus]
MSDVFLSSSSEESSTLSRSYATWSTGFTPSAEVLNNKIEPRKYWTKSLLFDRVQHWLANKKRPEDWGWERTSNGLQPVKTRKAPAPDSNLRARYPESVRRSAQEIAAVGRPDCFVQCCVLIVGTTAITKGFK